MNGDVIHPFFDVFSLAEHLFRVDKSCRGIYDVTTLLRANHIIQGMLHPGDSKVKKLYKEKEVATKSLWSETK